MKKFAPAVLFIILCFFISCNEKGTSNDVQVKGVSESNTEATEAENYIRQQLNVFVSDFNKGDSTALAAHYSKDALLMPEGHRALEAKDIASYWGTGFRMGYNEQKLVITNLYGDGNYYIEEGTWEVFTGNHQPAGEGKYIVVWKKEGDTWKMYRDIWNSNGPNS